MSEARLDFVIFGASGFTGQFVVEYAARAQQKEEGAGRTLTVGVAGRSKDKLNKVLDNAAKATGIDNLKDKLEVQ